VQIISADEGDYAVNIVDEIPPVLH